MSELAQLMARIDAEMEAAQRGLTGISQGSACHEVITAKTERAIDAVAPMLERAEALMNLEHR